MTLFGMGDPRPIHFMGIGGVGMSGLALLARHQGLAVTGCDNDPSGAADLAAMGVEIWRGHDPQHVAGGRAVVATAGGAGQHPVVGGAGAGGQRGAESRSVPVWRVGFGEDAEVRILSVALAAEESDARVRLPDGGEVSLRLRVPGLHNVRNAGMALAVAHALNADRTRVVSALERFTGVARRFERIGEAGGVTLVDDYAHHPTEVAATLAAARQVFPRRRVIAVFQ